MASPVGDSYAVASGGVIAAGRHRMPAWRRSLVPLSVSQIGDNTLASLNPNNSPAVNPSYPSGAEWSASGGHGSIVTAWNGAVWDESTGMFVLPLQGGHADWAGNERYYANILADSPIWVMPVYPTGAIGNTGVLNDGLESTGVYFDGRPRSIHSYNKHVAVPGVGIVLSVQGNCSFSGQSGTSKTFLLGAIDGEWVEKATHPSPGGSSGAGACYDSIRHRIWLKGAAGSRPSWLNLDTWVWTIESAFEYDNASSYKKLIHLPEHDVIFQADSTKTAGFCLWSPITGVIYQPGVTGSSPTGLALSGASGVDWDGSRLLIWHNSSNTQVIGTLTPTGDPETAPWAWGSITFSGVVPSVAITNGTYGRFAYSKRLNGCILQNEVSQKPYFFAIE